MSLKWLDAIGEMVAADVEQAMVDPLGDRMRVVRLRVSPWPFAAQLIDDAVVPAMERLGCISCACCLPGDLLVYGLLPLDALDTGPEALHLALRDDLQAELPAEPEVAFATDWFEGVFVQRYEG